MKVNIANVTTGCQKLLDIDDEKKLRIFYEKRIAQEVDASALGDQFKGYILRITGGSDKQGFGMKQGVLSNGRVRLLLDGRTGGLRRPTHDGERKRRTVRGCIAGPDLAVINTIIVKKGPQEIEGLTDKTISRRLGPKRASKIRKLFNLSKEDDVRKYVIRRTVPRKDGKKPRSKAPRIQRLVTSLTLQRKRRRVSLKKKQFAHSREEAQTYAKLLQTRKAESKKKRSEAIAKRRAVRAQERKAVQAAKAKRILKKIAERVRRQAHQKLWLAKHKTDKKLTAKQIKADRRRRHAAEGSRKALVHRLIQMRATAVKRLKHAREQLKKQAPTSQLLSNVRHFKKIAHELYLRIMTGARLPNLRHSEKEADKAQAKRKLRNIRSKSSKAYKAIIHRHKVAAASAAAKRQAAQVKAHKQVVLKQKQAAAKARLLAKRRKPSAQPPAKKAKTEEKPAEAAPTKPVEAPKKPEQKPVKKQEKPKTVKPAEKKAPKQEKPKAVKTPAATKKPAEKK